MPEKERLQGRVEVIAKYTILSFGRLDGLLLKRLASV